LAFSVLQASSLAFVYDSKRFIFSLVTSIVAAFSVLFFRYVLPLSESGRYMRLRWKAWTGPSRTGIPPAFSKYLGDERDWAVLSANFGVASQHPVEKFVSLLSPFSTKAMADPTDLLRARAALDEGTASLWVPRSKAKLGTYQPTLDGQSVSLLWGEHLGFRRRCSRGIISVSEALLTFRPTIEAGFDGRAVCLAYGILARNKGLEPWTLVCNLGVKNTFTAFEENSVLWPRPAKTLRGIYRTEFARTFSLLGESYITAATELGLLLADADADLIEDWLDRLMEHQDLSLNKQAAELGATTEDLARLYRGHYAAMLVSLSAHRKGIQTRPEVLVYDALCRLEGVDISPWAATPLIANRRRLELAQLGLAGERLIAAII